MSKKLMMNNYSNIEYPIYLVYGTTFNSIINQLKQRATTIITSIVFTKEPIPTEKISEGINVSESTSEYKAYGYVDENTIYISPEINGGILFANTNCYGMFINQSALTVIDLSNFNTSNTTNMRGMFDSCSKLVSLDLSNFDTSNVITMQDMFYGCEKLTTLRLSNFDTSKVTNMRSIFNRCLILSYLDLSNFDVSNVNEMTYMFQYCYNLSGSITINNPQIALAGYMFNNTSTSPSAKFIVKYIDEETKKMAEKLVAGKSSNSNVFLWEGEDV